MAVPRRVYRRLPHRFPREYRWSLRSLIFDDVDDSVSTPAGGHSGTAGTIIMWVKNNWHTNDGLSHTYLSAKLNVTNGITVQKWAGGALGAEFFYTGNLGSSGEYTAFTPTLAEFPKDVWHQLAFTWSNTARRFYLNSVYESGNAGNRTFATWLNPYLIGNHSNTIIDEVCVLNREYSLEEVRESFCRGYAKVEVGSVLNLRFEEGVGLIAYDESGFGNNGSLLPAISPPTWRENQLYELLAETKV